MRRYLILLVALLIFAIPSACTEIAYSSGPNGEKPAKASYWQPGDQALKE